MPIIEHRCYTCNKAIYKIANSAGSQCSTFCRHCSEWLFERFPSCTGWWDKTGITTADGVWIYHGEFSAEKRHTFVEQLKAMNLCPQCHQSH